MADEAAVSCSLHECFSLFVCFYKYFLLCVSLH